VRGWAGAAADLVSLVGRAVERPEQVLGDLVGGLRVVAVRVVVQQLAEAQRGARRDRRASWGPRMVNRPTQAAAWMSRRAPSPHGDYAS